MRRIDCTPAAPVAPALVYQRPANALPKNGWADRAIRSAHNGDKSKWEKNNRMAGALIQVIFELAAARGMAQLAQRFGLDLADALARDFKLPADLF